MPILEVLVGLPRSGKSTYAKQQLVCASPAVVVNPDSIRLALHGQRFIAEAEDFVWAIAKTMVRSLFLAGHNRVLIDATNMTRARRSFWKSKSWQCLFVEFPTPVEVCMERAAGDPELQAVIQRMHKNYEPIGEDER